MAPRGEPRAAGKQRPRVCCWTRCCGRRSRRRASVTANAEAMRGARVRAPRVPGTRCSAGATRASRRSSCRPAWCAWSGTTTAAIWRTSTSRFRKKTTRISGSSETPAAVRRRELLVVVGNDETGTANRRAPGAASGSRVVAELGPGDAWFVALPHPVRRRLAVLGVGGGVASPRGGSRWSSG